MKNLPWNSFWCKGKLNAIKFHKSTLWCTYLSCSCHKKHPKFASVHHNYTSEIEAEKNSPAFCMTSLSGLGQTEMVWCFYRTLFIPVDVCPLRESLLFRERLRKWFLFYGCCDLQQKQWTRIRTTLVQVHHSMNQGNRVEIAGSCGSCAASSSVLVTQLGHSLALISSLCLWCLSQMTRVVVFVFAWRQALTVSLHFFSIPHQLSHHADASWRRLTTDDHDILQQWVQRFWDSESCWTIFFHSIPWNRQLIRPEARCSEGVLRKLAGKHLIQGGASKTGITNPHALEHRCYKGNLLSLAQNKGCTVAT